MSAPARGLRTAAALLFVLALGLVAFVSTGPDDPYISYWPAYAIVHFGELVNYGFERVEQSSSLFHVLVLALVHWISGVSLPLVSYIVGIVAGAWTLVRCGALARALGESRERPGTSEIGLLLVIGTTPAFLYWWFAGLETTLAAWLTIEVAWLALRPPQGRRWSWAVGVTLAYLAVRPESFVVLISAQLVWFGCLVVRRSAPARPMVVWCVVTCAGTVALLLGRVLYFGDALPQPVAAKAAGALVERLEWGGAYYARLFTGFWCPLLVPVLVALPFAMLASSRRAGSDAGVRLFLWLFLAAQLSFVLFSGGDWMAGERFFASLAPLALVLGRDLARGRSSGTRIADAPIARALVAVIVLVQTGLVLSYGWIGPSTPLWAQAYAGESPEVPPVVGGFSRVEEANRLHLRDVLLLPDLVRATARIEQAKLRAGEGAQPVRLLSTQAGFHAYHLAREFPRRVEFIDLRGLASRHLTEMDSGDAIPRTPLGLRPDYGAFLDRVRAQGLAQLRPDIVTGVLMGSIAEIEARGYRLVYLQQGVLQGPVLELGSRRWSGGTRLDQYVAVDARWAFLFEDAPRRVEWRSVPGALRIGR